MAYSEELATRVRVLLASHSEIVEKRLFGGLAFLVRGNMACGVRGDDLIVRVSPDAYEPLLDKPGARIFDITGRPMKGWLQVDPEGHSDPAGLESWVFLGLEYAFSLPPK